MSAEDLSIIERDFLAGERSVMTQGRSTKGDAYAVTERQSYWLKDICPRSRHSFRIGDRVEIDNNGDVQHDDETFQRLVGGGDDAKDDAAASDGAVIDFLKGAYSLTPPDEQPYLKLLLPGDPLVAMPEARFKRHVCAVCNHTLRPGETVLICPCDAINKTKGRKCMIAMHHDVANGLYCFGEWSSYQKELFCPAFLKKI